MGPTRYLAAFTALLLIAGVAASAEPPAMVVHRGANHVAPENTYAAAQKCIELGVEYVEVDVRTSRDGVFYIMHDKAVDRTTNGSGLLNLLTSTEIDKLDAGSWFGPEFAGEPVPRLENFLRWIKGQAKLYFDVKNVDLEQFIALIRKTGFEKESFFWFGNPADAIRFHQLAPDLAMKINAHNPDQVEEAKRSFNAKVIETSLGNVTPELIAVCRRNDIRIMAAPREETAEEYFLLLACGADYVNINRPELYVQVKERLMNLPLQ